MTRHDLIVKAPATYQDLLDAPDNMVAEIIDGALSLQPRPIFRHAIASSTLGIEIGGAFQRGRGGPGGWWIVDEPELHLGSNVVVPDLAGWRRERMPDPPDTAYVQLAPDWICEVLSASTRTHDQIGKRRIYEEHGVDYIWFVDPDARTLQSFRLTGDGPLLTGMVEGDEEVALPPFEAVPFNLGSLWLPDPEKPDAAT